MIKEIGSFDAELLYSEYKKVEPKIVWGFETEKGKQAALQYRLDEDIWKEPVDRAKGNELEYHNLNPIFKDTIFEEIIIKYKLRRTRFMWLNQWSCYTLHRDISPRIHFPISTNPQSFIILKDSAIEHLKAGVVYYVDTRKLHTAMNGSDKRRLHLIGATDVLK